MPTFRDTDDERFLFKLIQTEVADKSSNTKTST